jgi:hypothetical protein
VAYPPFVLPFIVLESGASYMIEKTKLEGQVWRNAKHWLVVKTPAPDTSRERHMMPSRNQQANWQGALSRFALENSSDKHLNRLSIPAIEQYRAFRRNVPKEPLPGDQAVEFNLLRAESMADYVAVRSNLGDPYGSKA